MLRRFMNEEAGFIVSAELILVATILVLGLVVGLSEVQHALVAELNDVGDAIGSLNQSYMFSGFSAKKNAHSYKSYTRGSIFTDHKDDCDDNQCDIACDEPVGEKYKW